MFKSSMGRTLPCWLQSEALGNVLHRSEYGAQQCKITVWYTYLRWFGCIYIGITGQRGAFKANLSNLNYELFFIFWSHFKTHKQDFSHFFWVSWPGRSAPPLYAGSWSTYSCDTGSSAWSILHYKLNSIHLHCHVDILFRAKRKAGHKQWSVETVLSTQGGQCTSQAVPISWHPVWTYLE